MARKLLSSLLLLALMAAYMPAVAQAQDPIYMAENSSTVTINGLAYPRIYSPYVFHSNAINEGRSGFPASRALRWRVSYSVYWTFDIESLINGAFSNWIIPGGQPVNPNWVYVAQDTNPDMQVSHLQNCAAIACMGTVSGYVDTVNKGAYGTAYTLYAPSTILNAETPSNRQQIINHEIGHLFGMEDRYNHSGGCQNGETSLMESLGCHVTTVPQGVDLTREQAYYRHTAGTLSHDGTVSVVGGSIHNYVRDYANLAVLSQHQTQYLNGSTWVVAPYNTFNWYSMADNRQWGSDTFSGKSVSSSLSWGPNERWYRLCSRPVLGFKGSWVLYGTLGQIPPMEYGTWTCSGTAFKP